MSWNDLTKTELLDAAEFYEVDVKSYDSKGNIIDTLEEHGVTFDMWQNDKPPAPEDTPVVEEVPEEEESLPEPEPVVEDEPEPAKEEESDKDELVLVRFSGTNLSYTVGKTTFEPKRKPFGLITREQFSRLDQRVFREASREEINDFYGR